MSQKWLATCGVLILYSILVEKSSASLVTFQLIPNGNDLFICNSSHTKINVRKNDTIHVSVSRFKLYYPSCSLVNQTDHFLGNDDFNRNQEDTTAKIQANRVGTGKWNCTFFIREGQTVLPEQKYVDKNNKTYTRVQCKVHITVGDESVSHGIDQTTWYYIGGGIAGALIVIIIIAQTILILYLKKKTRCGTRLSYLQTRPMDRADPTRYSAMPGERKRSAKRREESGIYQSLENLRSGPVPKPSTIKERPPMPLPSGYDSDEDRIYCDGNTLRDMFAPEPPSVDTLPKNRSKKSKEIKTAKPKPKTAPKPTKNVPIEEYDYADTQELIDPTESMNRLQQMPKAVLSRPTMPAQESPRPVRAKTVLSGSRPIMNELDNVLKSRNNTMLTRPPEARAPVEPAASLGMQLPRRPPKGFRTQPDLRPPQDVREMRAPPEARPQDVARRDTRPQLPAWADARAQAVRSPPIAKRVDASALSTRAPPTAMIPPMQMTKPPPLANKPQPNPQKPIGLNKPLPPPPESDIYEPVAQSESSDDEEWEIEPLKEYNIYNV